MSKAVVVMPRMPASSCKECGCLCLMCDSNSLDLHHEIEKLRSQLTATQTHSSQLEEDLERSRKTFGLELHKIQEEYCRLKERYDRMGENLRKGQKINSDLEDKLLHVVGQVENEKETLSRGLDQTAGTLLSARAAITTLQEENISLREECNALIDCTVCSCVSQTALNQHVKKIQSVPNLLLHDISKTSSHGDNRRQHDEDVLLDMPVRISRTASPVHIPMMTFPPSAAAAMFYSSPGSRPHTPEPKSRAGERTPKKSTRLFLCRGCRGDVEVNEACTQTTGDYSANGNGALSADIISQRYRARIFQL